MPPARPAVCHWAGVNPSAEAGFFIIILKFAEYFAGFPFWWGKILVSMK
jgi:hypothetical protein